MFQALAIGRSYQMKLKDRMNVLIANVRIGIVRGDFRENAHEEVE